MSNQRTATPKLAIRHNEPEGWLKAFEVTANGQHASWFSYRDSAVAYVEDRAALVKAGAQ